MRRALALAPLGTSKTSPNPLVGCVIVKDNRIIGEGWHRKYGEPHAEIEAINDVKAHGEDIEGATLYVTLEPCSHYGKTPPCANRIVQEKISEVVIAMRDPNPKVDGKGIKILRDGGIKVTELSGEFENHAKFLNRGFVFVHKYSRPFVTLKAALSLDGRMCLPNGASKWFTGERARVKAHAIRAENDAVLVGANTVINDDPELTVRHVTGINPLRVILDTKLSTPPYAKIIGNDEKCLILTGPDADAKKLSTLENLGASVVRIPCSKDHIHLKSALEYLAKRGVLTLMVEGGAEILSSFLREGLADYMTLFFSPRILGTGRGLNFDMGLDSVSNALKLECVKSKRLDDDTLIEGRLICSPDL